ncbi:MAG: serine-type D-Ala-D-Ala carboxypeptidase, partial [Gammaproteobacteria bacterium]
MKLFKHTQILFLTIAVLLVFTASAVQAAVPIPAAPKVAAKNYILVDADSGSVLAEKEADLQVEPASITKMMTAY